MDSASNSKNKGLLNEEDTKKKYQPEFKMSDLLGVKDEVFSSYEVNGGTYVRLDDDEVINDVKKFQSLSYSQNINSKPQQQSNQNLSNSNNQKSFQQQMQYPSMSQQQQPRMKICACNFCRSKVAIPENAKLFKCCYCKNVNDRSKIPSTQTHSFFICGKCKQTVAYIPVSPYVRCMCGSVNYIPPINQGTHYQNPGNKQMNQSQTNNVKPNQDQYQQQYPQFQQQQQQQQSLNNSLNYNPYGNYGQMGQQLSNSNQNQNINSQSQNQNQPLRDNYVNQGEEFKANSSTNSNKSYDIMPNQLQSHSDKSKGMIEVDFLTGDSAQNKS